MIFNQNVFSQKKYIILALGIVAMLSMGTIFSWSALRIPLEKTISISPMQSGFPFLVFLALYAFSMPFAGKLIEKYKPHYVAIAGSFLLSLGYILSGYCTTLTQLIISYGVIGGIGVGTLYGVPIAMASRWFPKMRGLAIGLTLLGFGISPLITAPVISYLIEHYTVFYSFKIIGIIYLFVLPLISLSFRNPVDYNQNNQSTVELVSAIPVTKTQNFYLLWFLFFIMSFSGLLTIGISSPFSQDVLHINNATAAFVVSFLALFNGVGRLSFGIFTDKFGLRKTLLSAYILLTIASLLVAVLSQNSTILFVLSLAIIWCVFGGCLSMAPLSIITFFGEKNATRNYGKLFTAYGCGAILGVSIVSKVKEITGSYQSIYYLIFVLSLIGLGLLYLLFKSKEIIVKELK